VLLGTALSMNDDDWTCDILGICVYNIPATFSIPSMHNVSKGKQPTSVRPTAGCCGYGHWQDSPMTLRQRYI